MLGEDEWGICFSIVSRGPSELLGESPATCTLIYFLRSMVAAPLAILPFANSRQEAGPMENRRLRYQVPSAFTAATQLSHDEGTLKVTDGTGFASLLLGLKYVRMTQDVYQEHRQASIKP